MMLTAVEGGSYVATKSIPVAFRSNEPVHLPCQLTEHDGLSR